MLACMGARANQGTGKVARTDGFAPAVAKLRAEKLWSAVLAFNLLPMYMIGYLNVNLAFLRHTNSTLPPPTRPVLCRRR